MKLQASHILILACNLMCNVTVADESIVSIGRFSDSSLEGWEEKSFKGNTSYQLAKLNGMQVLHAESRDAASGLYYEKQIDLNTTPYINWQWNVEKVISGVDETTRDGDDYPARVYVIFSGGLFFWQTRAINYVWSNNQAVGTDWKNAFTENARMIALESGGTRLGKWVREKRNIKEDYKKLFGEEVEKVDAIAIMTDTDNSGQHAIASYGDIYFSTR